MSGCGESSWRGQSDCGAAGDSITAFSLFPSGLSDILVIASEPTRLKSQVSIVRSTGAIYKAFVLAKN
jgi:hypothetical protein